MKPAKSILVATLVVVTGTSTAIIIHQQGEIELLRARSAIRSASATAPLEPAPAAAPAADIVQEQEAPPAAPAPLSGALSVIPPDAEVMQQRSGPRGSGADRFAELLADPEIARMMKGQQKAELDGRYATLFKRLGLSAPETEALKELLAERQLSRMEARAVARAEGVGGNERDALRDIVTESDDEIEARIGALLGADRFATLEKFESTTSERARVAQFAQRLSYSPVPLEDFQNNAMVDILALSREPRPGVRISSPDQAAAYLGELEAYDAEVYNRARSVLNSTQLDALAQMQQERRDRVRLGALMRQGGG